jgi:hypothetical protein
MTRSPDGKLWKRRRQIKFLVSKISHCEKQSKTEKSAQLFLTVFILKKILFRLGC